MESGSWHEVATAISMVLCYSSSDVMLTDVLKQFLKIIHRLCYPRNRVDKPGQLSIIRQSGNIQESEVWNLEIS